MAQLLTSKDVAARLGITVRQVSRLVERGKLTFAAQAPGPRGAFLFDPADIDALTEPDTAA